jgi:hypothetical protein
MFRATKDEKPDKSDTPTALPVIQVILKQYDSMDTPLSGMVIVIWSMAGYPIKVDPGNRGRLVGYPD